ncbi:Probable mannitol dehydrogenase [Linum grandiflorum]
MIKNEWGTSIYPIVPGHEIVGLVTKVGSEVEKFKIGDRVGVGCMVASCRNCHNCSNHLENYCPGMVLTYSGPQSTPKTTYGGYSDTMVCDEHFVVRIPDTIPMDAAAPLLCAGITVYSPMRYGLGHVAVKFLKAMGVRVTVISTSSGKKVEALERLGADSFLVSKDQEEMNAAVGKLDGIIDTVSATHSLLPLIGLLKTNGKLILVGAPDKPHELPAFPLLLAKHNVTADIEVIPMDYVNTAMQRLAKADVKYRFVIDVANTI